MADNIHHGIDDNPNGDAQKGAALGGIGGAVTGLAAGSIAGPVGAVLGAIIGGVAGAAASGAAVAAVDRIDNDNTVSGLGGTTHDLDADDNTVYSDTTVGNSVPGVQTGGYTAAGTHDSRGIMEKTADTVTGDVYDDKQGVPVAGAYNSGITGVNRLPGEEQGSLKTGGYANDGTPDTRGVGEKVVDGITGDVVDDKTGRVVDHR